MMSGNEGRDKIKKKKGTWDPANMHAAVQKVLNNEMSARQAADKYKVPRSTLNDKILLIKNMQEVSIKPVMGRFHNTFSSDHEQALADHVQDLANRLMPLNKYEFLKLAFQLAEKLKIPHQFNREKKIAGKNYYYSFMKRYSNLSLRTAESTSLMRAVGFNKVQVERFFEGIENLTQKYNFTPYKIWNCDETGVSIVQKHSKVIATKNQRQVGKLTSAERGKNVTVLFAMNAGGQFLPPLFVFPRVRLNDRLMINCPFESIGEAQPNGWMTAAIFLKWMHHFIKYVSPTEQNPVLLVLDGHSSHKDLEVIEFARKNHIHMISTPPRTTHKLQPLDRTFMKPFKSAYNEACDLWMRSNPGIRVSEYEIAGFVSSAFNRVSRVDIGVNGFRCTGIHPLNKHVFSDLDFIASEMTNIIETPQSSSEALLSFHQHSEPTASTSREMDLINLSSQQSVSLAPKQDASQNALSDVEPSIPPFQTSNVVPATSVSELEASTSQLTLPQTYATNDQSVEDFKAIISEMSPVPDASKRRATVRRRKAEKSEILTSSPYKKILEEKQAEKNKIDSVKRRMSLLSSKEISKKGKDLVSGKQVCKSSKKPKENQRPTQNIANQSNTTCPYCLNSHDENWIQCGNCKIWVHEACAYISELSEDYICDYCLA